MAARLFLSDEGEARFCSRLGMVTVLVLAGGPDVETNKIATELDRNLASYAAKERHVWDDSRIDFEGTCLWSRGWKKKRIRGVEGQSKGLGKGKLQYKRNRDKHRVCGYRSRHLAHQGGAVPVLEHIQNRFQPVDGFAMNPDGLPGILS